MTPSAWRDGGRGQTIRWTTFDSPIGPMFIAATSKGICRLTFDDSEESLRRLFPHATIVKDDGGLKELVEGALEAIEHPAAMPDLPIDVAGTAFQEAVWRELRKIPPGETRSYAEIAAAIGAPKGGPRRRFGQRRQPCRGADPVPPRDPQRRDAWRLCRRARQEAQAAGGGGPPVRCSGTAAGRISACPISPVRLNSSRKREGLMAQVEITAAPRPLWRRIVDFPLVTMVIAIVVLVLGLGVSGILAKFLFPSIPGLTSTHEARSGRPPDHRPALLVRNRPAGRASAQRLSRSQGASAPVVGPGRRRGRIFRRRRRLPAQWESTGSSARATSRGWSRR